MHCAKKPFCFYPTMWNGIWKRDVIFCLPCTPLFKTRVITLLFFSDSSPNKCCVFAMFLELIF